jgi:hypothetical protein
MFRPNVSPTANLKPKIITKDEQRTSRPELQINSEQKPILFRQPAIAANPMLCDFI